MEAGCPLRAFRKRPSVDRKVVPATSTDGSKQDGKTKPENVDLMGP
jgi:hypothetical protein